MFFNTRFSSFTWNLPVWQTGWSVSPRAHPASDSPILGLPTFTSVPSSSVCSGVRCRPSDLCHHKRLPHQAVLPARTFCNDMLWWSWNSHLLVLEELLEYYTSKHFSPKNHSVDKEVVDPFLPIDRRSKMHVPCFCWVPAVSRSEYKSVLTLHHEHSALRVLTMTLESPWRTSSRRRRLLKSWTGLNKFFLL